MSRIDVGPRFGIVIPVRHMPGELPGAIESILSQEIGGRRVNTGGQQDVDLIVVVDDLEPETQAVLEGYGVQLRWVEGDRRGQAGAVNKGLSLTRGDIVKWVNADDRLLPGALEAVDRAFREVPSTEFVYGDILFLDAAGHPAGLHLEPGYSRFILLCGHNLFADPACFWKRSLHDRIGPIAEDTRFSLDYEFWVRVVKYRVEVAQVRQALAAFKVTGDNMSVVNHRTMKAEHYEVMVRHYPGWRLLPVPLRDSVLSALKLLARVWKRVRSRIERGPGEVRTFARLMAAPEQGRR